MILCTVTGLALFRVYLHYNGEKPELKAFPKQFAPEKSSKPAALDEKTPPTTIQATTAPPKAAGPRRVKGGVVKRRSSDDDKAAQRPRQIQPLVFFSSITANTGKIAADFAEQLGTQFEPIASETGCAFVAPEVLDLAEVDFDDYFISPPKAKEGTDLLYLFLFPSYNIDTINDTFLEHLQETHHDFRIDTAPLRSLLGYSVFGFGDREGWPTEPEGFCFQAKQLDKWMAKLTNRKRAAPVGTGDRKSVV